jgi:hypothetical protein
MKKVIFLIVAICLVASACTKKENKFLIGGWKMVQMQRVDKGKITNYFSDRYKVNQTKMWTDNHFMFVGKYEIDTLTSYRYGVGSYKLNGKIYEEDIAYHFEESYEGQKNKILLDLRADTLYHVFPVDDNGVPNQKLHWIEKYIRLEK